MQEVLAHLFRSEGDLELCGLVASAEEAEAHLDDSPCDLLLTDVSLPGMDGIELATRVRRSHPDLPVVVVSVNDDAGTAARAQAAGARAFLSKGDVGNDLASTLRDVLGRPTAP